MEYKKISLACDCGTTPTAVTTFGLTADRQLMIQWECTKCGRHVCYLKALTDCWRDCPGSDRVTVTPADRRFLREIGVKNPDSGKSETGL